MNMNKIWVLNWSAFYSVDMSRGQLMQEFYDSLEKAENAKAEYLKSREGHIKRHGIDMMWWVEERDLL